MSDDYEVGYKRPPTETRFKPGKSGNPKGRPRRSRRAAIPSQRRRDVLTVAEMLIDRRTPSGIRKLTISQAVILSVAINAMKGNAACAKLWLELDEWAINERARVHPTIRVIEYIMSVYEDARRDPDEDEKIAEALDAHLALIKGVY